MTDRYNYLTVALEEDIRSDDAEELIKAITLLRGVLKVAPNVADPGDWTIRNRVRQELTEGIWEILRPRF